MDARWRRCRDDTSAEPRLWATKHVGKNGDAGAGHKGSAGAEQCFDVVKDTGRSWKDGMDEVKKWTRMTGEGMDDAAAAVVPGQ